MPATRVNSQSSKNTSLNINNNGINNFEKVNVDHHNHAKNNLNDFCKNWPLSSLASSSSTFSNQSPSNVFHQLSGKKIIQEKLNQIFIPPNNSTSILASFVASSSNEKSCGFNASSNACSDKLKSNTNLLNRSLTMNFHDRQKILNLSFSRAGTSRQSLTTEGPSKNVRFNNNLSNEHQSSNNMRVRFDMKTNQNINPYDKLFINRATNNFKFNPHQNYSLANNLNDTISNIDIISSSKSIESSDFYDPNSIENGKFDGTMNYIHFENDNNIINTNNDNINEDCICCVAAKINGQVFVCLFYSKQIKGTRQ